MSSLGSRVAATILVMYSGSRPIPCILRSSTRLVAESRCVSSIRGHCIRIGASILGKMDHPLAMERLASAQRLFPLTALTNQQNSIDRA